MTKLSERVPLSFLERLDWHKELAEEVEAMREWIDIRESKQKQPVDRHLVEEALAICQDFDAWHGVREIVAEVRDLLRHALEEQDAQD